MDGFQGRWQFLNCIGVLDGKHIRVKVPPKPGINFHNYKGYASIVLLALVDRDYKILFYKKMLSGKLRLPTPQPQQKEPSTTTPFIVVTGDGISLVGILVTCLEYSLDLSTWHMALQL